MKFLVAAYIVTWLVHFAYFGRLVRGYRRVRAELKDIER